MDTTPLTQPEPFTHSKTKGKYVAIAVVVLLVVALIGGLVWLMLPYLKEQYIIQEGQKREGYLKQLPDNPAAADLTFEDRQRILSGESE